MSGSDKRSHPDLVLLIPASILSCFPRVDRTPSLPSVCMYTFDSSSSARKYASRKESELARTKPTSLNPLLVPQRGSRKAEGSEIGGSVWGVMRPSLECVGRRQLRRSVAAVLFWASLSPWWILEK